MQILVKLLKGDTCPLTVNETTSILDIKKELEDKMKVPVVQQSLILFGKPLNDDQVVADYPKLTNGAKVHLIVKKAESMQEVLSNFLKKYYNEMQTKTIVDEFLKDFNNRMNGLSLDDFEKMATSYLNAELD